MKKNIFVLALLCLCLVLCACEKKDDIVSNSEGVVTESGNKNKNDVIMPNVERPLLTIESMDEYQQLLDSSIFSSNFVPYSQISRFGNFVSLIFLSDTASGDYSSYMYNMIDETGYEITLRINDFEVSDTIVSTDVIEDVNTQDMRQLSQGTNGHYIASGLKYRYVSGKLLTISWVSEGVEFELGGVSMLYDYPTNSSTILSNLMDLDDALVAMNSMFYMSMNN